MFIFAILSIFVILSRGKARDKSSVNDVDSQDWGVLLSVSQGNEELPSYDIKNWVQQLHLQQCAFVEVGEGFCALFVELRSIPSAAKIPDNSGVGEFFLGLCDCATVRSWALCSDELVSLRHGDCVFTEAVANANTSARVHRRLCDVTLLSENAPTCNCSIPMANQQLYRTEGFPTCFRNPLPDSLCSPRGVCGVAQCSATTIRGIHSPRCDPECHEKQPFCEEVGPWTSLPPLIHSLWTRWSTPVCSTTCGKGHITATAICRNQLTGKPAIDCIGPGSFCCPADSKECNCEVTVSEGVMKAIRTMEPCTCTDNCKNQEEPLVFREVRPDNKFSFDQKYEEADHLDQDTLEESMDYEADAEYDEPMGPLLRRLMSARYDYWEDYYPRSSQEEEEELREEKRAAVIDEIDDDDDDDEDDDEGDLGETDEDDVNSTEPLEFYEYGGNSARRADREAVDVDEKSQENTGKIEEKREEDCDDGSTDPPQYADYDEQNKHPYERTVKAAIVPEEEESKMTNPKSTNESVDDIKCEEVDEMAASKEGLKEYLPVEEDIIKIKCAIRLIR